MALFFVGAPLGITAGSVALNTFSDGQLADAASINENFANLNAELAGLSRVGYSPVGAIVAWHKSLANTPALPAEWVECNGQTLNDPASPFHGQVVPNLNGAPAGANSPGFSSKETLFLRGSTTSGTGQNDAFQGHHHQTYRRNAGMVYNSGANPTDAMDGNPLDSSVAPIRAREPVSDGTNGTPRIAAETRPRNMSVVWVMRVK